MFKSASFLVLWFGIWQRCCTISRHYFKKTLVNLAGVGGSGLLCVFSNLFVISIVQRDSEKANLLDQIQNILRLPSELLEVGFKVGYPGDDLVVDAQVFIVLNVAEVLSTADDFRQWRG